MEPLDAEAIAKLVDEAPQVLTAPNGTTILMLVRQADIMDETTLKKMLLAFERKISANQMMRMKFPDQPQKCVFMLSDGRSRRSGSLTASSTSMRNSKGCML